MSEGKELVGTGKIRDSCNSCSSQKIRCGKERPSCARCTSKGLVCEYSISMRTGRPSRAQSKAREAAVAAAAANPASGGKADSPTVASTTRPAERAIVNSSDEQASGSVETMISNHDTADYILAQLLQDAPPHEDIWMQGEADEIPGFSTNVELMYSMLPSDTQFMDFDWELPHEIQESGAEATQAQPLAMVRTPYLAGPVTSTARPQSQLEVPPEPSHPQQPSQQQPSIPRSQPTPSSEEADTPASSCSNRGQNCLATLFQLALDLHVPSQSCTSDNTTSATSLDLDNTTAATPNNSSPIRGVDAVLLQNRAAAQSLSQILDCPCSKALSVTLAVYLVASKIVAWYGAIVGVESADHHHHHHHHHPSSLIERIVPSPIYMGAYSLGADVHRSVRANVVVSELGTLVEPMLAKLPHFHHALGNDCSNQLRWSSSSASSLSSLLSMESSSSSSWPIDGQACALRAQLRCIVDEANRPMCR